MCDLISLMFSAILITGGCCGSAFYSAEVFLPATSASCELPGLVLGRSGHTQAGLLLCGGRGGSDAMTSCEQFSPATGTWARTSHTLQQERASHVSWCVEEGTLLMGGSIYGTTSEIAKHDGTTETSFDLKYDTWYETIHSTTFTLFPLLTYFTLRSMSIIHVYRAACSIPDPSHVTVVVTGGYNTLNTVSRYERAGCTVLYCPVLYFALGTGCKAGLKTCHRSM